MPRYALLFQHIRAVAMIYKSCYSPMELRNISMPLMSEKTSLEIDRAMLTEVVDYEPTFDPNDSMQNVLDDFLSKQ